MSSPLIRTLQLQGGTFVSFTSAARDLSKSFGNENLRFVFSKFVALNLPNNSKLDYNTFSHYENYLQFNTIDGAITNGLTGDVNIDLTQSFQNYALNFETLLLANTNYDTTVKKTVAERVFFKWLKEIGGIRFRDAVSTEVSTAPTDKRFVEENEKLTGATRYNRVVQYIGDIDIVNNVDKAGTTYTEVWLHIPTEVGKTPVVLFDALDDANYYPDMVVTGTSEYLHGRTISTIHPEGLNVKAFYDYDDPITYAASTNANWYNQTPGGGFVDSYFTALGTFEDASNIDIKKDMTDYPVFVGTDVAYRRSNLDGITIDFDAKNYAQIVNDGSISTIQEYNGTDNATNFEFNAVMVYYDLFDISDPTNKATNLYGILFLDNMTPDSSGGFIPRLAKYKPNKVTKQNGNSWGLVLNLKFDASIAMSGVDTIVNEYNTFSMGLFVDVLTSMQESTRLFEEQRNSMNTFEGRITSLENNVFNLDSIQTLNTRMSSVESLVSNAQIAFDQSTTLLDLIAQNSDEIQNIVNGNVPLILQYNTDVLYAGNGIVLDKSVPNKIKVTQKSQEYNLVVPVDTNDTVIEATNQLDLNSSQPYVWFDLQPFTNMCRLNTKNAAITDVKIHIDDLHLKFSKGQTVRIVFKDSFDINGKNLLIYTDANNNFGSGVLGLQIAQIDDTELSDKPIIEIICINPATYEFEYDIIR